MSGLENNTAATRFDSFDVYRTSYKRIGDHNIEVGILIPKNLKTGKHPLHVKFHGGGLVVGDCLFKDWFASFFVPFTHRNSAITILPNYRLTPESSGAEILSDVRDFWIWFFNGGLTQYLESQNLSSIELDFDRVLTSGESAGGGLALLSGLSNSTVLPDGDKKIRAVLGQYPMTSVLEHEPSDEFFGMPAPKLSVLEEHIAAMKPGVVVSSGMSPERLALVYLLGAYGRYREFYGEEKHLWPITAVEDAERYPPVWIIHGEKDTVVKVEGSKAFVEKLKERVPGAEVRLTVQEGQEHGFECEFKESEYEWLREGLEWIEGKWLA